MKAMLLALLVASLLALATKLFTFEATLADDPTVYLVLRPVPALESRLRLEDSSQLAGALVIMQDENTLPASGVYHWVAGMGWWLLPLLSLAAWGLTLTCRSPKSSRG